MDSRGRVLLEQTERFRRVAAMYPAAVALAYDRDLAAAAADTDQQVAARVGQWEADHGLPVRNWPAIGATERADERYGRS